MRIAVFAPDTPYPPNRGGRADIWRRILAFRALGHQVMLVHLHEPAGPQAPSEADLAVIDAVVAGRFTFPMRRGRWRTVRQLALAWHTPWHCATRQPLQREMVALTQQVNDFAPDLLWLDGPWFGRVVLDLLRSRPCRLAYRSHNVEHRYLWQQASAAVALRDRLAWHMACVGLARFERQLMDRADRVFDISMDDMRFWQDRGVQRLHWLPPLPESAVADACDSVVPGEIVFVGNLTTPNNVRGVEFLLHEVLPRVHAKRPNARCAIVGSRPSLDVHRWVAGADAVELRADVEAPMAHLLGASVLVNPVMTGSGVQLKMLDMLMTDRPIVTTTQGTRGLPGELASLVFVADDADSFAQAVCLALEGAAIDLPMRRTARRQFGLEGVAGALRALCGSDV